MSTPPGAAAPAKRDNIFTRKIGPLSMWVWLAIATALLLGWAYYKNKTSPSQSPSNTANASQVPQFVNQTYTTVMPPVAPNPVPGKDTDKDKDKDSDKDKDGHTDDDKHKKKPVNRRHPTHHDRGDDGSSEHGGSLPGQQFTPRPGPPTRAGS